MNREIEHICELYIDNRNNFKYKNLLYEGTMLNVAALLCAYDDYPITKEEVQLYKKMLKGNTGVFSAYRNNMLCPMIAKMAMTDDPYAYLKEIQDIALQLEDTKVFKSEYSVIAAMIIYENNDPSRKREFISKTKIIHQIMKNEHSFLTDSSDIVFAALLATSDIDSNNLLLEMDECFLLLKEKYKSYYKQELSHILALNLGSPGEKVEKFMNIFTLYKAYGLKVSKMYNILMVGLISLLEVDDEILIQDIIEVDQYLKVQKGFHGLSMDSTERLIYAISIVTMYYSHDSIVNKSVLMYVLLRIAIERQAAAAAAA